MYVQHYCFLPTRVLLSQLSEVHIFYATNELMSMFRFWVWFTRIEIGVLISLKLFMVKRVNNHIFITPVKQIHLLRTVIRDVPMSGIAFLAIFV